MACESWVVELRKGAGRYDDKKGRFWSALFIIIPET
jgi:hypothetical protein